MNTPDLYKPLQNFGFFFVVVGMLGFLCLFTESSNDKGFLVIIYVAGIISFFHLFLGVGVILRNRQAFKVFKGYLRLLYFGFPIGTYIAKATLEYIKKNSIENYLR